MKLIGRTLPLTLAAVSCGLLCGTMPVSSMAQEAPCAGTCVATFTLNPAGGQSAGNCNNSMGTHTLAVSVSPTNGACSATSGPCAGNCSFQVNVWVVIPNACANILDLRADDCGTITNFTNLGACVNGCFVHQPTITLPCGSSCNATYTLQDTTSDTLTVTAGLACSHPCP
jgi:hypothetical protein